MKELFAKEFSDLPIPLKLALQAQLEDSIRKVNHSDKELEPLAFIEEIRAIFRLAKKLKKQAKDS